MKTPSRQDPLTRALEDWRRGEKVADTGESFSSATRANLLAQVRHDRLQPEMPRLARLFVPVARMAAASLVPALALALTVAWLGGAATTDPGALASAPSIEGSKLNGEAIFRIANGGRPHTVYRSTSPQRSAEEELLGTARDSFKDRLEGTSGVVYYRID